MMIAALFPRRIWSGIQFRRRCLGPPVLADWLLVCPRPVGAMPVIRELPSTIRSSVCVENRGQPEAPKICFSRDFSECLDFRFLQQSAKKSRSGVCARRSLLATNERDIILNEQIAETCRQQSDISTWAAPTTELEAVSDQSLRYFHGIRVARSSAKTAKRRKHGNNPRRCLRPQ